MSADKSKVPILGGLFKALNQKKGCEEETTDFLLSPSGAHGDAHRHRHDHNDKDDLISDFGASNISARSRREVKEDIQQKMQAYKPSTDMLTKLKTGHLLQASESDDEEQDPELLIKEADRSRVRIMDTQKAKLKASSNVLSNLEHNA